MLSAKLMDSVHAGWILRRREGGGGERRVPRSNSVANIKTAVSQIDRCFPLSVQWYRYTNLLTVSHNEYVRKKEICKHISEAEVG